MRSETNQSEPNWTFRTICQVVTWTWFLLSSRYLVLDFAKTRFGKLAKKKKKKKQFNFWAHFFDNKSIDLKLIREKEETRRREFQKRHKYVKRQKKIIYRSNFVLDKITDVNSDENENENENGTLRTKTEEKCT
ncbi:hypothetical protein M0812_03154 [Anaeramoeba flamelloides]|uniref:Uncharacterized protein n=1 Tax=Anaeramoeba flamelloides TaxID=1746091 RepID=A0AAV7YGD0_9EUKA|nr:hypothetical protein M0812_03154 [Anaeramoeba flamelloides]